MEDTLFPLRRYNARELEIPGSIMVKTGIQSTHIETVENTVYYTKSQRKYAGGSRVKPSKYQKQQVNGRLQGD